MYPGVALAAAATTPHHLRLKDPLFVYVSCFCFLSMFGCCSELLLLSLYLTCGAASHWVAHCTLQFCRRVKIRSKRMLDGCHQDHKYVSDRTVVTTDCVSFFLQINEVRNHVLNTESLWWITSRRMVYCTSYFSIIKWYILQRPNLWIRLTSAALAKLSWVRR